MGTFIGRTASNGAKIKEGKEVEVKKLLDKYDYPDDLCCEIDNIGNIQIHGEECPRFWLKEKNNKDELGDTDDYFEEFLEELAPLLAEDLVIHSFSSERGEFPFYVMELKVTPDGVMHGGQFKWFY
jgi:hypothetical protein